MREEYAKELNNIARVSTVLMVLLGLAVVAMLMVTMFFLKGLLSGDGLSANTTLTLGAATLSGQDIAELDPAVSQIVAIAMVIFLLYLCSLLGVVIRLLSCFRARQVFTAASVRFARIAAWMLTGYVAFNTLSMVIWPHLLQMPREGIEIHVTHSSILLLAVAWMFVWILQVGKALQFDSEMAI